MYYIMVLECCIVNHSKFAMILILQVVDCTQSQIIPYVLINCSQECWICCWFLLTWYLLSSANWIILSRGSEKENLKLLFSPLEGGGAMNHSLIIDHSNCLANIYHRRHNHHYCCLLYSFRCYQHHHCHRNNCSITINHSNSLIYDVKDVIKEGQG